MSVDPNVCWNCGHAKGRTPRPDDCPWCGAHWRWAHRTDGRQLLRQFERTRGAIYPPRATKYPPPPGEP